MRSAHRIAATCVLTALAAGHPAGAGEPAGPAWPQWLGPLRQGFSPEKNVPDSYPAEGLRLLWKTELGGKNSSTHWLNGSPVVGNGRVYVIGSPDSKKWVDHLYCLSLADGKEQWSYRLGDGHAQSTPLLDLPAGRVYAKTDGANGRGGPFVIACLDAETGKEIWRRDAASLGFGKLSTGAGAPLLFNDLVIAAGDKKLVALKKDTGSCLWSWPEKFATPPPGEHPYRGRPGYMEWWEKLDKTALSGISGHSSPIVLPLPEGPVVLQEVKRLADSGYTSSMVAVDARDGRQLWLGPSLGSYHTPVFAGGNVVTTIFVGSPNSYAQSMEVLGLRPVWKGKSFELAEAWRMKGKADVRYRMPTPAAAGDRFIWRHGNGALTCAAVADGTVRWKADAIRDGWALSSPVWADGKVFAVNDAGRLWIGKDGPAKAETLLVQQVCQVTGSTPAIVGGRLVTRDRMYGVYCYELTPPADKGRQAAAKTPVPPAQDRELHE